MEEKNKEPNVSIPKTSYKASIERKYLTMMTAAKWVEGTSIEDITEDLIYVVQTRVERTLDEPLLRNTD